VKNTARNAILVSELLIFGLFALILFLTIPEERLEYDVFWIAFSFAIPVNFCIMAVFTFWGFGNGSKFTKLPIAFSVSLFFAAVYLIVGALFMYLDAEKTTFPIILYSVITVIYIITALYSVIGAGYMTKVDANVKAKRMFIAMLEADVLDCALKSTNPDMQSLLRAFADDVRYSDPMSHQSLSPIETDISAAVYEISAMLTADASADVTAQLAKATALLKSRNSRCMMLK